MRTLNVNLTSVIVLALALIFFTGSATSAKQVTISYSDWQLAQDIWGRSLREAIAEFR